ncbi:MAG TPA: prolipoprotein diacylglyceryl transferase, partial [Alphaproteobacteria bacterium]
FGRLANFINGELFGRVTDSKWGMVFPHGGPLPRYPTQLMEAVLEGIVLAAILAVLVHMKPVRERPGIVSGVFLCGYAVFRIFVEFFREPDRQVGYLWGGATMGQVLCVPMILGGLFLIGFALIKGRHDAAGTNHQAVHRG